MIILDTNVLSEPTRERPSPHVLKWLNLQRREFLFFSTISLGEVLAGIETMPKGKRRTAKALAIAGLIGELFGPRILDYDRNAAEHFARIISKMKSAGKAIALADAQICAIASAHGFAVATRDIGPFVAAGVDVINPWDDSR